MISIIIPVYNSEKYLRKCLDSICNQTYSNLEIICVNDGSTDSCSEILQEYQTRDKRIKVITQENSGQGCARNRGLEKAQGEYIAFVDSDDWIDLDMMEDLYSNLMQAKTDISICDLYRTDINDENAMSIIEEQYNTNLCKDRDKNYVFNISSYPVGKLYKRKLFHECEFAFPNHFYEDISAIPVLLATADCISFLNKPKYYYRNHTGSTVYSIDKIEDRITCMYSLVDIFKNNGLFEKYRDEMESYIVKRVLINTRMMNSAFNQYRMHFIGEQNKFLNRYFPNAKKCKQIKVITWGSYNLYTISKCLMNSDAGEILTDYYGGESLVSLFGKKNNEMNFLEIKAENQFRQNMVINDVTSNLLHRNVQEFADCDAVLIDFLEERFNLGVYKDNIFTLSDAFMNAKKQAEYEEIEAESKWGYWKNAAEQFAVLIKKYFSGKKIILLKMKLCQYYGEKGKETLFDNVDEINQINDMLEKMYCYFEKICPDVITIALENRDYYYTYTEFRHGCFPWHLRNGSYREITKELQKIMMDE